MLNYIKTIAYGILVILLVVGVYAGIQYSEKSTFFGGQGGAGANSCTIFSQAEVIVNPYTSTEIVASHAQNAWVHIEQGPSVADNVYLGFGATAVVGAGTVLASTTATINIPTSIDLGLNTDFPFTGAVNGITSSATTTVNVVVCRY